MADNQITPFQLTDQFTMDNFNQRINETNTALQKKADTSSVYNKEESISTSTRTALSLPETATPDAALAEIARQLSESGGLKMDLLWENASPGSSFAAQTLTVDFSGYNFLLFLCGYSTVFPTRYVSFITKAMDGYGIYGNIATGNSDKVATFVRSMILEGTNSIVIQDGTQIETTASRTDNSVILPSLIYGIKLTS